MSKDFEQLQLKLIRCFINDAASGDPERLKAWLGLIETLAEVYEDWQMSARTNNIPRHYLFYQMAMGAAPLSGLESAAFLNSSAYRKLEKNFQHGKIRGLAYLKDALGNGNYCYAPQGETEAAIKWYAHARESALASEVEKFRTTAGITSIRLAELWQEEPKGAARALDLLEATPDDAFSEGPRRKLHEFRKKLGAEAVF